MKRALRAAGAAILVCLAIAPAAHAAYDPLGGGTTKLILDKRFTSFLAGAGVKLSPAQGAKRKGSSFLLSISGGTVDPTVGMGEIDQEGSLVFQNDRRRVPLKDITLKTKHSPLIAKVGGSQLKVAVSSKLSFRRKGFASAFSARALTLSAKVASRLNKKLRPKTPFTAGQPLGTILAKIQPRLVAVLGSGRATLIFDSAFLAKLSSRFVSISPVFPAERQGASFSFPIVVGGAIAPDGSEGTLRTGGTVELLQLGGGQVFWQEVWLDLGAHTDTAEVDLEPTPAFAGKLGRVGVFDAAPGSVSADPKARMVSASGIPLTLQAATAKNLNDAFAEGQPLFTPGESVGVSSFTAQGQ